MKGILLAGGSGTRLSPMTKVISKHLLPIYDKPMIYYSLSALMLAGVREVLFISTPDDLPMYRRLFGDGSSLGMRFSYAEQARPEGIAQAFLIGEQFIAGQPVMLVLGDNIFFGQSLGALLEESLKRHTGATVFGYHVADPARYGVAVFDPNGRLVDIEEKPKEPKSNYAITGMYVYDGDVARRARALKPSARGELEITDLNRSYLKDGKLQMIKLGRGSAWLDAGTPQSLLDAASFIATVERRQGLKIACLEELAYRKGFVDRAHFERLIAAAPTQELRGYLRAVLEDEATDAMPAGPGWTD